MKLIFEWGLIALLSVFAVSILANTAFAAVTTNQYGEWSVTEYIGEDMECVPAETYGTSWTVMAEHLGMHITQGNDWVEDETLGNYGWRMFANSQTQEYATEAVIYIFLYDGTDRICKLSEGVKK